ncbi:hypothetical protein F5Y08DRAFT_258979 [Xylaria arbuscula]|nr:hypothetical protein F5Y08DRAFT_258979 [Xylaria arbuscula]
MAGPASEFQLPTDSFFNIYADAPLTTNPPSLPGGPCNYVDLTPGAGGHKCGCRRFWSRASVGGLDRGSPAGFPLGFTNGYEDQTVWCMCSHHACFHDNGRDDNPLAALPVALPLYTNGQENERPRTNREPLTPVVADLSFNPPGPVVQHMDLNAINSPSPIPPGNEDAPPQAPLTSQSSLPDTLAWANLVQSEPDPTASLPPIPSQCLMASQPSSTTSSMRIRYLKPFAGKGLQTLSGVRSTALEPLQERDKDQSTEPEDGNTTEHETDQSVNDGQTIINTPRSTRCRDATDGQEQSPMSKENREAYNLLSNTVQGHGQRIENLENISFSAAAHDTCHEKHDQSDLRITELESRVEEFEKILNDNANHVSGWSRRDRVDDAAASVVSVSTSEGSYIMDRAELQSELESLKAQLSQLQGISSIPSLSQPWEVEVVFLPFPLKNIWLASSEFGSQRLSNGNSVEADSWVRVSSNLEPHSPALSDWAGPEIESDWLLPRACSSDNTIGQRLKSRGLVKNVTVCGPDARSIHQALSEAFGTLFRTFSRMQGNVHHGSSFDHRVAKYLGLQSPWVPLRKIHKNSRLRFLTPAEMVTPAMWDVQFLTSSVVMKSHGTHRLFITHPEAYLQNQDAQENGWTWQRLRELSRVYADSQSSQEILEGDAKEECWVWNTVLDEPPTTSPPVLDIFSIQARPSSAQQHWRAQSTLASSRDVYVDARTSAMTASWAARRSSSRAQSSAVLRERRVSRPPRIRTTSTPPVLQQIASPAIAKRRSLTHAQSYERSVSPQASRVAQMAAAAKRRNTRSPHWKRSMFTPHSRWGTSSPSPMPEAREAQRGKSPYATPYSNAPFVDTRPGHGDVDIYEDVDIDFDFDAADSDGSSSNSDTDVYDDNDDELESELDGGDSFMADPDHDSYETHSPVDDPRPGIEDIENQNPDVNIHIDDDAMTDDAHETESQGSSAPSEFPSNQPPYITSGRSQEFRGFEDK